MGTGLEPGRDEGSGKVYGCSSVNETIFPSIRNPIPPDLSPARGRPGVEAIHATRRTSILLPSSVDLTFQAPP